MRPAPASSDPAACVARQAEEVEMQEFLDRLDFDDYFSDWVSLATSVSSADLLGASAR
jgi:hypothetical protein